MTLNGILHGVMAEESTTPDLVELTRQSMEAGAAAGRLAEERG